MKISNFTQQAPTAIVETVQKKAIDKVFQLTNAIKNGFNPPDVVKRYDEAFDEIDLMWKGCVKHNIRYGHQLSSIIVRECNHYKMTDYANERFNFKFNKSNRRMDYTFDKFLDMSKMAVAFLVAKYKEVYTFEVEIAVVRVLLYYFDVYVALGYIDTFSFCLASDDIYKVINTILQSDMQSLKPYIDKIGDLVPTVQIKTDYKFVKPKPTTKEDIQRCITSDDMTQTEIVESIMENWDVCRRTAYNLMKKYGLTRQYKKADEAAENVAAVQQQASGDISSIDDVRTLRGIVLQQRFEIAELKAEIERLTNQINR